MLQHHIAPGPVAIPVVEEVDSPGESARQATELLDDEGLEELPERGAVRGQRVGVETEEGAGETAVAEVNLGRLDEAAQPVAMPGREFLDEEHPLEERDVVANGGTAQRERRREPVPGRLFLAKAHSGPHRDRASTGASRPRSRGPVVLRRESVTPATQSGFPAGPQRGQPLGPAASLPPPRVHSGWEKKERCPGGEMNVELVAKLARFPGGRSLQHIQCANDQRIDTVLDVGPRVAQLDVHRHAFAFVANHLGGEILLV